MHSLTPQIAPVATGVSPALRQAMDCWGALPEFLPVGIYSCDDRGGIVQFNRRAAELWGRSPRTGASGVRFCGACKAFGPDGAELDGDESPVAEVLRTGLSSPSSSAPSGPKALQAPQKRTPEAPVRGDRPHSSAARRLNWTMPPRSSQL